MKKILLVVILLFSFNDTLYSIEPKLIWSNQIDGISEILYTASNYSGDTLVLFEAEFINIVDSKTFEILKKISIYDISSNKTLVPFVTQSEYQPVIYIDLPKIIIDNLLINIDKMTCLEFNTAFGRSLQNVTMVMDNKSAIFTKIRSVDLGKGQYKHYSEISRFVFETEENISIREFENIALTNTYQINDSLFICTSTGGMFLYNDKSTNAGLQKISNDVPYNFEKGTQTNDFLYLFSPYSILYMTKIIKDSLQFEKSNLNYYIPNLGDSTKYIYGRSTIRDPNLLFLSYEFNITNNENETKKQYGVSILDFESDMIIFNRVFDNYAIGITISNNEFIILERCYDTNDNNRNKNIFHSINMNSNEDVIKKEIKIVIPKQLQIFDNDYYLINGKSVEVLDELRGNILYSTEHKKELDKIYKQKDSNGYYLFYKDQRVGHTEYPDFDDYPFYTNMQFQKVKFTPDQSKIIISDNKNIIIIDTKTLNIINNGIIKNVFAVFDILNDSVLLVKNHDRIPCLYSIKTGNVISKFNYNFTDFTDIYYSNDTKKVYGIKGYEIFELIFDSKLNFSIKSIYKHNSQINKLSFSNDNKYLAMVTALYTPQYPDIYKNYNLFVIDLETQKEVFISHWKGILRFDHVLFLDDPDKIVYIAHEEGYSYDYIYNYSISNSKIIDSLKFLTRRVQYNGLNVIDKGENDTIYYSASLLGIRLFDPYNFIQFDTISNSNYIKYIGQPGKIFFPYYIWKQNLTIDLQQNWYLNSYNINTNEQRHRLFSGISSGYFYKPNGEFGLFTGTAEFTIHPITKKIKHERNVDAQYYHIFGSLSKDTTLIIFKENNITYLKDYISGKYIKQIKNIINKESINFTDHIYDRMLLISTNSDIEIVEPISAQTIRGYKINKGVYANTSITSISSTYGAKFFFSGHNDGKIRYWRHHNPNPVFTMNIGSKIKSLDLIQNDSRLLVNTIAGYMYCYDLEDFLISDINERIIENQQIVISPNPSTDFITITLSNKGLKPFVNYDKVQIFDMLGIEIMSELIHPMTGSYRMNVEKLPAGVYFIRIGNMVEKFVKI